MLENIEKFFSISMAATEKSIKTIKRRKKEAVLRGE